MRTRRHDDFPRAADATDSQRWEWLYVHGSRNFRNYRRRATIGYLILALGVAGAFYLNIDERNHRIDALARAGAQAVRDSCTQQKHTNYQIRVFVKRVAPGLAQRAARSFPIPDCEARARPLARQSRR